MGWWSGLGSCSPCTEVLVEANCARWHGKPPGVIVSDVYREAAGCGHIPTGSTISWPSGDGPSSKDAMVKACSGWTVTRRRLALSSGLVVTTSELGPYLLVIGSAGVRDVVHQLGQARRVRENQRNGNRANTNLESSPHRRIPTDPNTGSVLLDIPSCFITVTTYAIFMVIPRHGRSMGHIGRLVANVAFLSA